MYLQHLNVYGNIFLNCEETGTEFEEKVHFEIKFKTKYNFGEGFTN